MALGHRQMRTEHSGAKNGGGAWMPRREAKNASKKRRRRAGKEGGSLMAATVADLEALLASYEEN